MKRKTIAPERLLWFGGYLAYLVAGIIAIISGEHLAALMAAIGLSLVGSRDLLDPRQKIIPPEDGKFPSGDDIKQFRKENPGTSIIEAINTLNSQRSSGDSTKDYPAES